METQQLPTLQKGIFVEHHNGKVQLKSLIHRAVDRKPRRGTQGRRMLITIHLSRSNGQRDSAHPAMTDAVLNTLSVLFAINHNYLVAIPKRRDHIDDRTDTLNKTSIRTIQIHIVFRRVSIKWTFQPTQMQVTVAVRFPVKRLHLHQQMTVVKSATQSTKILKNDLHSQTRGPSSKYVISVQADYDCEENVNNNVL